MNMKQQVCDHVQPPVMSPMQVYVTETLGLVYMHLLIAQSVAQGYFNNASQSVSSWFKALINKCGLSYQKRK